MSFFEIKKVFQKLVYKRGYSQPQISDCTNKIKLYETK